MKSLAFIVFMFISYGSANATPISLNVVFVGGSCISLFAGCTSNTQLDFTDFGSALPFGLALLDQVFLDGPLGIFDTDPALGCVCAVEAGLLVANINGKFYVIPLSC